VIGLQDDRLAALDRGEVVTRQLHAADKPESVSFGVVEVKATLDAFLMKARNAPDFRRIPQTLETGVFHDPPRLEDLDTLTVPDGDLDDLRKCHKGDCDVMISDSLNARLQADIDWTRPDARQKARILVKQAIVTYLKEYLEGGTSNLAVLNDRVPPTSLPAEFHDILERSPYLIDYEPALFHYIEDYPKGALPGATDTFYWAKESFGLKPVFTVNHLTVYEEGSGAGRRGVVATREIYASHYFRTSLEVDIAAQGRTPQGEPVLYLLNLKRARVNPPGGVGGGVLLGKVRGAMEKGVALTLQAMKASLAGAP
jgi:hypothetical protein